MTMTALILDDVAVTYPDGHTAVRGVNLQVDTGEIVALLGASGSGKSTLLRGIAGLERITCGTVQMGSTVVDGWGLPRLAVHQRSCGMVFQDGQLFPHRTVGRNIRYGLETMRMSRAAQAARVAELLQLVGLPDYADRAVTTLSGGQAQRVALARSLATRPDLLLLDEPLSALDRSLRERLALDIRHILTSTGTSAVYVTHDHAEAFTVADRIILLGDGQIMAQGTARELLAADPDSEAGQLLGSSQRIRGLVTDRTDAGAEITVDSTRITLPGVRADIGDDVYLRLG